MHTHRPLTTDRPRPRPARQGPDRRFFAVAALALLAAVAGAPPPATAASHRLSQGLPFSDVDTDTTELSPDGRFVVYVHDATVDNARELWSARVAGGAEVISRPLCVYPEYPRYSGSGDVSKATSFTCVAP